MFRSTQLQLAALVLFAVVAVSLSAAPARAFSQGNGGTGDGNNSAFADPDEQVNLFGLGFDQGPQPSGLSGSVMSVGSPQSKSTAFKHFQIDSLTSPPAPFSRPSN
jgi:hypothetical protein